MPVTQFLMRGWNLVAQFVAQFFDAVLRPGRKGRESRKSRPEHVEHK
jgi:hypothetical protein